MNAQSRDRPVSFVFFETDIFKNFFTDIWSAADVLLTIDTDILKFAYRYIWRYFNKVS